MPVNADVDHNDMLCEALNFAQSTMNPDAENWSCLSFKPDAAADTKQRDSGDAPPPIATKRHNNWEESLQSALM